MNNKALKSKQEKPPSIAGGLFFPKVVKLD
jgi:hypothetical protein